MTGNASVRCRTCTLFHPRNVRQQCSAHQPRWPLDALLAHLSAAQRANMTATFACSTPTLDSARRNGLADQQADRWAVRVGFHPEMVWPGWCDAGLTVVDRQFIESGWRQAFEWAEASPEAEAAA